MTDTTDSDILRRIESCEVCHGTDLEPVLDLGLHPMCDDLVEVGSDRVCREFPIEILYCPVCATAHQKYQIAKHALFPTTYHYRARHTGDVLRGMEQLVQSCAGELGTLEGLKVLDIGCNDGSLLSFFKKAGATTFGIEPTGAAADARAAGHDVIEDYFSPAVAEAFVARNGRPDLITFTNVFAHIEDLGAVIAALRTLVHPRTMLVIENHYLGAIVEKRQFDTFYHEHPRTYSYRSFTFVADALGMRIVRAEFPARYGGNIRVFIGPAEAGKEHWSDPGLEAFESGFGEGLRTLAREVEVWKKAKSLQIAALVEKHGTLRAKAFPGRSAIPIKLLGIDAVDIGPVYEKPGSAKIGHYVPGTRIAIVSDDDFDLSQDEPPVLNLAWHISDEISSYLRKRGYRGEIVDLIAEADFADNG